MLKMFFILLIIVVYFHNTHSLKCIANSSFEILRSKLNSSNNSFTLKNIRNTTIDSSANRNLCYVTILIDYNQTDADVIVNFGPDTSHTINYLGIETWFLLVKADDSITSYIEHVCSSDDFCDRAFVEKWIHLLTNISYKPLQDKLIYLLTSDIHPDKCEVAGVLTSCSSGMCIAEYNVNINKKDLGTDCVDNTSTATAELYVKIQSIELKPMQYEELSYTRMSDGCNNMSTVKLVKKQTTTLFDLVQPIMKWLNFTNLIEESAKQRLEEVQKMGEYLSNRYAKTPTDDL